MRKFLSIEDILALPDTPDLEAEQFIREAEEAKAEKVALNKETEHGQGTL